MYILLFLISSPSSRKHSGSVELQRGDNTSQVPPVLVFRTDWLLLLQGHIIENTFTCSTTVPGSKFEVATA